MTTDAAHTAEPPAPDSRPTPPAGRLNIFACPARTTLFFALIVLILLTPPVASLLWQTPICGPELAVVMLFLPLRRFLALPERQAAHLLPLTPELRPLQEITASLAQEHVVGQAPQLLLDPVLASPYTFGTWRRRALVLSAEHARWLLTNLQSGAAANAQRARAILLHELSHFRNQDVWMTFLSQSFIIVAVVYMTLHFLVYLQIPFINNILVRQMQQIIQLWPQVCDWLRPLIPGRVEAVCDNPLIFQSAADWLRYQVFNLAVHVPFIVGGLILLNWFWRGIVRTREFYADARTAAWLGNADVLLTAIADEENLRRLRPMTAAPATPPAHRRFWPRLALWTPHFHPTWEQRLDALARPETLYGSPREIGVIAALAVLSLEFILGSALSAPFVPEPGSPTLFVLGFVLLSISLLPRLCVQGDDAGFRQAQRTAFLAYSALMLAERFSLTAVFSLALWVEPTMLEEVLRISSAFFGSGGQLDLTLPLPASLYVWLPLLFNLLSLPLLLWPLLRLDAVFIQRSLNWFAAPWLARRFTLMVWGLTGLLALGLWLVVFPLLVTPLFGEPSDLLGARGLGTVVTAALVGVGLTVFAAADRRWHGRCVCGAQASPFRLGRLCPDCQQPLQDWLLARYTLNEET